MADITVNSGTDAEVAFRLYLHLVSTGRAVAPKKEQALALFRECKEAVQHRVADGTIDVNFVNPEDARL